MTISYPAYQSFFEKYNITSPEIIQKAWQEKHRFYHTEEHLSFLLQKIHQSNFSETEKDILRLVAFFHDIVYYPKAKDNEQRSAEMFLKLCQTEKAIQEQVVQMILDTQTHQPTSALSKFFCEIDLAIVKESSFAELLDWEKKIFKEFQVFDYSLYKAGRLAVLEKLKSQNPENAQNLQYLIEYLKVHKPNIGIYPGSFNPFHNGHFDILEKAERVFDKVIVARGINPEKTETAINDDINPVLYYRQTEGFTGFLTDYIRTKEQDAHITLIRGLRNGDDLAYEMNQISFMKDLKPDLKVVFFHCDREFEHISSSAIRNLEKISKGCGERYLPK
jgi:pantetheine-phosphate adenylyltransferase